MRWLFRPPSGGGNILAGTITFPAPAVPYPPNTTLSISVTTVPGSVLPDHVAAKRRNDLTIDAGSSAITFKWNNAVTYSSPPQITPTNNTVNGKSLNFGLPFLWQYTSPSFLVGIAPLNNSDPGLVGTLPAGTPLNAVLGLMSLTGHDTANAVSLGIGKTATEPSCDPRCRICADCNARCV